MVFLSSAGSKVIGYDTGNSSRGSQLLSDDAVAMGHSSEASHVVHVCRSIRRDCMNHLNLQGAVHIRDGDLIIEELDIVGSFSPTTDRMLSVCSSTSQIYVFALFLCQ